MIKPIVYSDSCSDISVSKNHSVIIQDRLIGENNLDWLKRMNPVYPLTEEQCYLLLVGGDGRLARRLRHAQSRLRHDLLPSLWSHVLFIDGTDITCRSKIYEISLEPKQGFGFAPAFNAIQYTDLASYAAIDSQPNDLEHQAYPNIALLRIPVSHASLKGVIEEMKTQRLIIDFTAYIVQWLSWGWGIAENNNPLLNGVGIPSSILLQVACSRLNFDLSPGVDSQISSPELIWQSVLWWNDFYQATLNQKVDGAYTAPQQL